jgi:hypothetical protein
MPASARCRDNDRYPDTAGYRNAARRPCDFQSFMAGKLRHYLAVSDRRRRAWHMPPGFAGRLGIADWSCVSRWAGHRLAVPGAAGAAVTNSRPVR